MSNTKVIPVRYDGGCTSILLPQWLDQTTRPNQKKFLKLAAQHRTDCPENVEAVKELGEYLDEAIANAKKEAAVCEAYARSWPEKKEAQTEVKRAKNALKRLQDVKTDYTAALEKYK